MVNILTTTTNTLEGWTIKEYLQPISSNVVVGANVFSDISASWTDFFGGRASSYEKKLQDIYQQAISNLSNKAKASGANCIVGLKIDIDEISGKGSQMFMITAFGTPVKAIKDGSTETSNMIENVVDGSYVENRIKADALIDKYRIHPTDGGVSDKDIEFILESRLPELNDLVIDLIKRLCDRQENSALESLTMYFRVIDRDVAINLLHEQLLLEDLPGHSRNHFIKTITDLDLIQFGYIPQLLDSRNYDVARSALRLLRVGKGTYSGEEIAQLEDIKNKVEQRFPKLGTVTKKKKLLSSSEKDVWVCACGATNDMDSECCTKCGKDIYGFMSNHVKVIDIVSIIDRRLKVLREIVGDDIVVV